jgi:hypothetical protein
METDTGAYKQFAFTMTLTNYSHSIVFNKKFWEELIAYFPWYDMGHIENDSSIIACVFVTAVTSITSRCLATTRGLLPSRCLARIRGFLPSRCLALSGGGDTQTHRQIASDLISLLYSFKIKPAYNVRHVCLLAPKISWTAKRNFIKFDTRGFKLILLKCS